MKKITCIAVSLLLACLCAVPALCEEGDSAHGEGLFSAALADGTSIFSIANTLYEGDEYIDANNKLYRVGSVSGQNALLEEAGDEEMPDISWLDADSAQSVFAAQAQKLICMYVTHSDESYIPTDGTESDEQRGGIYDVAHSLKDDLEALGITVVLDESTHLPHDGGAYRRSRQTAAQLIKQGPDALIDIHRDGIPDASEYAVTIDGDNVSRVRLLVGRSNQNSEANRAFAKQLKAVGDKLYPGLIKDIFIGKGNYNQDIAPHSILLEFGTHTLSKERVLASTEMMAAVLSKTLYGQVSGSASGGTAGGGSSGNSASGSNASGGNGNSASGAQGQNTASTQKNASDSSEGAGTGMWWIILVVIVGICVFAFLATGTGKGMKEKIARNTSEVTGGLLGKRNKDDHGKH